MEKVIISVPTLSNKENIINGSISSALILKAYKDGLFLPKNASNGDVVKALFPKVGDNFSNVMDIRLWWNAKFNARDVGGEKNDNT